VIKDRTTTSFTDINLQPETGYRYQLLAFTTAGLYSRSDAFAYTHYGVVVPFISRPINIDGDFSDWEDIKEVSTDATGNSIGTLSGTDFTNFYLARDNQ
jgi:hypothetical protein